MRTKKTTGVSAVSLRRHVNELDTEMAGVQRQIRDALYAGSSTAALRGRLADIEREAEEVHEALTRAVAEIDAQAAAERQARADALVRDAMQRLLRLLEPLAPPTAPQSRIS